MGVEDEQGGDVANQAYLVDEDGVQGGERVKKVSDDEQTSSDKDGEVGDSDSQVTGETTGTVADDADGDSEGEPEGGVGFSDNERTGY